jgi:hypothetical protein
MRKKRSVLMAQAVFHLLCVCLTLSPALAQQTKPVEPESMGVVYLLDSSDQTLKALPKERAKITTRRGGWSKVKGVIQIPEPASAFRLKSGSDLVFVVKCTNPESFSLYEFTKKGKNREAEAATAKQGFIHGSTLEHMEGITLEVTKYGESSYRFAVKALEPGEYGFVAGWNVFHFGVDPK